MEYGWLEIMGGLGGVVMCLLAVFVLNPDFVSRMTEGVLDVVEVKLALRQQQRRRRAVRDGEQSPLSLFESWQEKSG